MVLWNTVYLQQVVQTLRAEGVEVRNEDLARLPPARYEHINRLGKYTFPARWRYNPTTCAACANLQRQPLLLELRVIFPSRCYEKA